jgi:hypothetical protein
MITAADDEGHGREVAESVQRERPSYRDEPAAPEVVQPTWVRGEFSSFYKGSIGRLVAHLLVNGAECHSRDSGRDCRSSALESVPCKAEGPRISRRGGSFGAG